jgi:hypothetical protein
MMLHRARPIRRRGGVIIIVVWALAIAAIVTSSVQLFAFRQATVGRETVNRIQARWAARAGVENTIATLALYTTDPRPDDAFAIVRDLEYASSSTPKIMVRSSYDIIRHVDGRDWAGPLDEHSRLNINTGDTTVISILEDISLDQIAAISDWMDEDDEPGLMGAEREWYLNSETPYEPRNGPFRSVAELELVAGVWPTFVRGEDWNMNNRLDGNENDGERTLPDDHPDDEMQGGWASILTTHSVEGGATNSGEPRIHLKRAEPEELVERLGVDEDQAKVLIAFGKNETNELLQLITVPLPNIDRNGNISETPVNLTLEPLDDEQLKAALAELSMTPTFERFPGRLNVNTASPLLIRDFMEGRGYEETMAEEIIYLRNSRPEGLTSVLDFMEAPEMTPELLQVLANAFTTQSNVYTITARGRTPGSDVDVEIIVTVDRSDVPVRIIEYREQ